jgi:hypothetical protein
MNPIWVFSILAVGLGVPFTLWWWYLADKRVDAKERRFRARPDTRERVVVRGFESARPGEERGKHSSE